MNVCFASPSSLHHHHQPHVCLPTGYRAYECKYASESDDDPKCEYEPAAVDAVDRDVHRERGVEEGIKPYEETRGKG